MCVGNALLFSDNQLGFPMQLEIKVENKLITQLT